MKRSIKVTIFILLCIGVVLALIFFIKDVNVAVLEPKGAIGMDQRDLIRDSTYLMLIVVIPVLVLTFVFAWIYRAGNKKAKYSPEWEKSHLAEAIWWALPCAIIIVLTILVWRSSHALDPKRPLISNVKEIPIQVVALDWKWLFIYPEQNIAAVNYMQFPINTPLAFDITADAPMNSFWIPQLGGQIYAMPGMQTRLHLIANEAGSYDGCSSNISGVGFAGMIFVAKATSQAEFDEWVESVRRSENMLSKEEYEKLAAPSSYNPVTVYSGVEEGLYQEIVTKYMRPMPMPMPMQNGSAQ